MNERMRAAQEAAVTAASAIHPLRGAVVCEAFEWTGTPYLDCGDVKGPTGAVDCAMVLIRIFQTSGHVPKYYDPRPYNPDWHNHQDEKRYMAGLEKFSKQVESPLPGDIAMYRFGRHASHGGIVVSDQHIIHAHKRIGFVELCERNSMAPHLDSYWSVFQ